LAVQSKKEAIKASFFVVYKKKKTPVIKRELKSGTRVGLRDKKQFWELFFARRRQIVHLMICVNMVNQMETIGVTEAS
jgi:hypothetical protein